MLPDNLDTLARGICRDEMEITGGHLDRVEFARASAKIQRRPDAILKMKRGLVKFMGAAYYLRDAERFRAAVVAYQGTTEDLLTGFDVPPEALLVDLCLAIIHGPTKLRRATIAAIMRDEREPEVRNAPRVVARILAATSDLDRDAAVSDAWLLRGAWQGEALPDEQDRRYSSFAVAALRLNRGDSPHPLMRIERALYMTDRAVEASIRTELERIQRGSASAITASSFVDFPTAALAAIAASRASRAVQENWPATVFSDFRWMGESGWA